MADDALTPEQILEAAEEVLRRFGPSKATVVDVARALGVSHGTIYRHFPSKVALREAVVKRWLERVSKPLGAIAAVDGNAMEQLRQWFDHLIKLKHQKALADPELFATYDALASESRDVVQEHVQELIRQLVTILERGIAQHQFFVMNAMDAARGIFSATARFHHPAHAAEWQAPEIHADFERVWAFVQAGLTHPNTLAI